MSSLRIALTELRRITAGRLPKVALVALTLIPTLYGGLYLYANHDPYDRLDQVPAALVVEDAGATRPDGETVNTGRDVADELVESGDFGWERVDADQAAAGVRDGTYDFALTIPRGFTAALVSTAAYDPRQAQLRMTTNDANSYLSTTIADKVTASVTDAITEKVGVEAATQFLLGLGDIRGGLVRAERGAERLADGAGTARRGATRLEDGAATLSGGSTQLADGLGTLADRTSSLPSQTQQLASGARQVADANAQIAGAGDRIAAASDRVTRAVATARRDLTQTMQDDGLTPEQQQRILDVYDRLDQPVQEADDRVQDTANQLDRLATGADRVADGNRALADNVPALVDGITRARDGAQQVSSGADRLSTGAGDLATGLGRLRTGGNQLADGLQQGVGQIPDIDGDLRNRIADTIADPVALRSTSQATAGSYGAGLAPFFLSLSAWIGAYVLFMLVRPLSTRAMAADQTPLRIALGGWFTPALIGAAQVTVLLAVVSFGIDIRPANLPGTLAFLALASATFVAIVHALSAWFGKTGQFLGLVLMVLQLITAGGTFPWQTIPQPLYPLHRVLPMSYAVDGMRQLMYGGLDTLVVRDAGVLLVWLLAALAFTTRAARKQRVWTVKRIKPEIAL